MLEPKGDFAILRSHEDVALRQFVQYVSGIWHLRDLFGGMESRAHGTHHAPCVRFYDCGFAASGHLHRKRAEILARVSSQRSLLQTGPVFRGLLDRIHHRAEHAHFCCRDVLSRTVEIDNFREEQWRARDRVQHAAVVELDSEVVRRFTQRQMEVFVTLRSPERIQLQSKRSSQLRYDTMLARGNDDNRSRETPVKFS